MASFWSRDRLAGVCPAGAQGFSLLELLVAMTVMVILSTMAIPFVHARLDQSRTAGAARYVAGRLGSARMEAVKRSAYVAIQFAERGGRYRFAAYADGNRNGVRARDIALGIDRRLTPEVQLDEQFSQVLFGICDGVTAVEAGGALDAGDPIQIGRSSLMSFSPDGSATAGTVYIRGHGLSQFAVRVLGATGRIRVLRFDFRNGRWIAP